MEIITIGIAAIILVLGAIIHKSQKETLVGIKEFKQIVKDKYSKNQISFQEKYSKVGLPVITINILNNKYDFIIDTGANFNALDKEAFKRIVEENNISIEFNKEGNATVTGVGGEQKNVKDVKLEIEVAGLRIEENFTLVDIGAALNHYSKDSTLLCGVIGSDFLERHKWLIDFNELVVYTEN